MKRNQLAGLICAVLLLGSHPAWAATYAIDPDHSAVSFKIRHLFSYVRGTFDQFEGSLDYETGEPKTWKTQATIQAASIDTRVEKRDNHLRSKDFFEVEKYPTLEFVSTQVEAADDTHAKLHGLLTLHGVQKPVVLDLEIHGVGKDPWGNVRAGFTATTTINRKDFGINWNEVLGTGKLLLGEEVEVTLEVEGLLNG